MGYEQTPEFRHREERPATSDLCTTPIKNWGTYCSHLRWVENEKELGAHRRKTSGYRTNPSQIEIATVSVKPRNETIKVIFLESKKPALRVFNFIDCLRVIFI